MFLKHQLNEEVLPANNLICNEVNLKEPINVCLQNIQVLKSDEASKVLLSYNLKEKTFKSRSRKVKRALLVFEVENIV